MDRLRRACRTNDVQFGTVLFLTLGNMVACACTDAPWPVWLCSIGVYPLIAFLSNVIDPLDIGDS
jgi:hypothetical protein